MAQTRTFSSIVSLVHGRRLAEHGRAGHKGRATLHTLVLVAGVPFATQVRVPYCRIIRALLCMLPHRRTTLFLHVNSRSILTTRSTSFVHCSYMSLLVVVVRWIQVYIPPYVLPYTYNQGLKTHPRLLHAHIHTGSHMQSTPSRVVCVRVVCCPNTGTH